MLIRAAGAIVFDDQGRLLMVRRGRPPGAGRWSIPGGKCLPGESTQAACVRECAEETGLVVAVSRAAGRVQLPANASDEYLIEDFVCSLVDGQLQSGDDAAEARWVSRADFDQLELVDGLAAALAHWRLLPDD